MEIAYKVTFRADGIDVTQLIQADAITWSVPTPAVSEVSPVVSSSYLPGQSPALTTKGGGFTDPPGFGGGRGTPTIVFSCPIIITRDHAAEEATRDNL